MRNIFWPDVSDLKSAKNACVSAGGFAWFMGIATAILVHLQSAGKIDLGGLVDASSYIDVGILFILGAGLILKSRVAASAAITYIIANRLMMMQTAGMGGIASSIIQIGIFAGGVRGSFAYHQITAAEKRFEEKGRLADMSPDELQQEALKPKSRKITMIIPLMAGVIFIFALGLIVFLTIQPKSESESSPVKTDRQAKAIKSVPESDSAHLPEGVGTRAFKLKNGETVRGKIVYDDPVYFTIETSGQEKIVIKEDVAEDITKK